MSFTYVRCPKCGYVALDRSLPETLLGVTQREIICPRCNNLFRLQSKPYQEEDTADWRPIS